jgi:hypothetical protein
MGPRRSGRARARGAADPNGVRTVLADAVPNADQLFAWRVPALGSLPTAFQTNSGFTLLLTWMRPSLYGTGTGTGTSASVPTILKATGPTNLGGSNTFTITLLRMDFVTPTEETVAMPGLFLPVAVNTYGLNATTVLELRDENAGGALVTDPATGLPVALSFGGDVTSVVRSPWLFIPLGLPLGSTYFLRMRSTTTGVPVDSGLGAGYGVLMADSPTFALRLPSMWWIFPPGHGQPEPVPLLTLTAASTVTLQWAATGETALSIPMATLILTRIGTGGTVGIWTVPNSGQYA